MNIKPTFDHTSQIKNKSELSDKTVQQLRDMLGILKEYTTTESLERFLNRSESLENCCPNNQVADNLILKYPNLLNSSKTHGDTRLKSHVSKNLPLYELSSYEDNTSLFSASKEFNFNDVDFSNAKLDNVDFSNAKLDNVNFSNSDFNTANFTNTDFK